MKSLIIAPLLFLFVFFCNGQSSETKIDFDYFLLGTLNDYMGRENHKAIANRVDVYDTNNNSLVSLIDSIYRDENPDMILVANKMNRQELRSESLAQKMNDFFIFKPSGRRVYSGEEDIETLKLNFDSLTKTPDFYATHFDTLYIGHIKDDIFKNDSEKYSFLTGAFIKYGGKNDSTYFISMPNSVSKIKVATELLKELNCTDVEYTIYRDFIPVGHKVFFKPTDELKKYFEAINKKLNH